MQYILSESDLKNSTLKTLLTNSQSCSLINILQDKSCLVAYQSGYLILLKYLNDRIEELFELAVLKVEDKYSFQAFSIFSFWPLSTFEDNLFDNILKSQILEKFAEAVFQSKSIKAISRFSIITTRCCLIQPIFLEHAFPFLNQFLNWCYLRTVISMFEELLSDDEKAIKVQKFLSQNNFIQVLLSYIKTFDRFSNEIEQLNLIGVYKILSYTSLQSVFKNIFFNSSAISTILRKFDKNYVGILNEQWTTINSIFHHDSVNHISSSLSKMLQLIEIQSDVAYYPYQVSVLHIIGRLIKFSASSRSKIIQSNFNKILVSLFNKFPDHSFVGIPVTEIIRDNISFPDFFQYIYPSLSNILSKTMLSDRICCLKMVAWQILSEMQYCSDDNDMIKLYVNQLNPDVVESISKFKKLLDEPYGGDCPIPCTLR